MGTQVHEKGFLPGYYSMRDLNEDSSSSNWPLFYGDRTLANGQYCNFQSRTVMDPGRGYNKDALKQKMLEHEAIFKNQVLELHRLYRIQRDLMEEVKKKEVNKNRLSLEQPSSSSSVQGSQVPYDDSQKWHPLTNSVYAIPSTPSTEIGNSRLNCTPGNCEVLEDRPLKVKKKLFEEGKRSQDSKESFYPSYPANGNFTIVQGSSTKPVLGGGEKIEYLRNALVSHLNSRSVNGLADLNEPAQLEEAAIPPPVDFLGCCANYKEAEISNITGKPNAGFLAPPQMMWNANHGTSNGPSSNPFMESKRKERDWLSYAYKAGCTENNAATVPPFLEQNKFLVPFHPAEVRLSKAHQNPGIHQTSEVSNSWSCSVSNSGMWDPPAHFPSVAFNNPNENKGNNVSSGCTTNRQHDKFPVGFNFIGSKSSAKDFDLNVADDAITVQDEELVEDKRKIEDSAAIFPWLKSKPPVQEDEGKVAKSDSGFIQHSLTPPLSEHGVGAKVGQGTAQNVRKILGVPILENHSVSKNQPSVSTTDGENIRNDKKNIVIDINVAFDDSIVDSEDQAADREDLKGTGIKNHFDLNSCITEDEDPLVPSVASNNVKKRRVLEIDLEAPIVLDDEGDNPPEAKHRQDEATLQLPEHKAEQAQDEVAKIAAESIVALSSLSQRVGIDETCRDPLAESLRWFVDAVSSGVDELESKSRKEIMSEDGVPNENSSSEGIDYFEAMTLRLTETNEDYMPKPFSPPIQTADDTVAASVSNRTRKGPGRRGRQRRDFQRDILPGLTSLSRHEVTEDLQMLGGLMGASGLPRRNGRSARGRKRAAIINSGPTIVSSPPVTTSLMHQLNNMESVFEDRSLTGWGKTTRRPRGQRCPAGNPSAAIALS